MSSSRVAFLGMGKMGGPMARRLLDRGLDLVVWNRDASKSKELALLGASVGASAAEAVSGAELVITMLSDGPVVHGVLFERGVAEAMSPGSIFVDMSSIPPNLAREHAERLLGKEVGALDAPVSGGTIGAAEGTLAILCGGKREVFEEARPVLEILGRPTHVGPAGTGQLAKLCNQVIVATTIGAVSEALLLAQAGGAIPEALLEALQGGFADSRILREHGKRMLGRDWRPGGRSRLQLKDLHTVFQQAQELDLELPLLNQVRDLFQSMVDAGEGEHDHAGLLLQLERMNSPHRVGEVPDRRPED